MYNNILQIKIDDNVFNNLVNNLYQFIMWTTTYAPTHSKDIIGGKQTAVTLSKWLNEWTRSQPKKAALLSGPPGGWKNIDGFSHFKRIEL